MNPLVVENLSMRFGALQALQSVSFAMQPGERRAIIGPNGAGKTTLFSLVSGTLLASEGRIHLLGKDITRMASHQRAALGLARTFQITNLFPNLSVLDNIILGIQAHQPMKFALHRPITSYKPLFLTAQQLLETWELWEFKDQVVRNLSYGVQRQVEILLALSGDPKVLLLDEPTAGLSPAETQTVTSLIRSLDRGMCILLIEHDMDVAFDLVDHITVLHQGEVLADGSPEEIRANPRVTEIYLGTEEDEEAN